jgi:gas vesicle protein
MFSRVRIAIRFFFMGLAVGVLLAPRSGKETRRLVRERADRLLNDLLDAATLGSLDSGAGAASETDDTATTTRTGNGRSRSRSSSTAQAQA